MSRRSRRSIELPWLRPFIRASWWDPSSLAPVAFSGMDMENEKIYVSNLGNDAVSLGGYCICDFNQNHWFKFPSSFVLSPRATVSVFCCPGLHMDRDPVQPFLQWTNKDGTLRSAHVLNDDKETVYLYNAAGLCVSTCIREHGRDAVILRHSHLTQASRNLLSKCKLFLCYVRLLVLLYAGWCASTRPSYFILSFLLAHACDLLGRCIWLGDSDIGDKYLAIDPLLDAMNTTADRLSTLLIMLNIIMIFPTDSFIMDQPSFILSVPTAFMWLSRLILTREHFVWVLVIDFMSHWMRKTAEVYYASSLSSVTEAFKTPLHHLITDDSKVRSPVDSSGLRRRSIKGRRKSKSHQDLGHHLEDPAVEQDAVFLESSPDTDELDLIDILRARFPVTLSAITIIHELMLIVIFSSLVALRDLGLYRTMASILGAFPYFKECFVLLLFAMVFREALLFVQLLTSTSRISFEVLSWNTRRQVIPRMQ